MVHVSFLASALVASNVFQITHAASGINGAASGLNAAALAKGKKYFGTATDNPELTDADYEAELRNIGDWGQITVGNTQKWDTIEPSQNEFNFTGGDTIVSMAEKNGQMLRCHNLVWYNQLPSWVSGGTWTKETLTAVLQNHITNEVTHYKGKCYAWDVVNEALNDDGSYRSNVFYDTIGSDYIPIAFAAAAAADPKAKLYYNDYNIESHGDKSTAAQEIVKLVKGCGAKIDGVGLQSHFIVGDTPSEEAQASNMAAFTKLGVEVAITELDIRMNLPSTDAELEQQKQDYKSTVSACVQTKHCVGITVWDYSDRFSWVPGTFPGTGAAAPFDKNLAEKPAYCGIMNALGVENAKARDIAGEQFTPVARRNRIKRGIAQEQ